jgi:alpha-ketoglutaric semialdehyde dehydrogenase
VRTNAPHNGRGVLRPFGGIKASSIGPREQGYAARDSYTESRTLLISP